MKVVRQNTMPVPVHTFLYEYFPNEVLYSAQRYVYITKEGNFQHFFVFSYHKQQVQQAQFQQYATLKDDIVSGVESEINFKIRNQILTGDDMAEMRCQVIMFYDNDYPDPDNIPEETTNPEP